MPGTARQIASWWLALIRVGSICFIELVRPGVAHHVPAWQGNATLFIEPPSSSGRGPSLF